MYRLPKEYRKGIFNAVYTTRNHDPLPSHPWRKNDTLVHQVHFDEVRLAELLQAWILEFLDSERLERCATTERIECAVGLFQDCVKFTRDDWYEWDLSSDAWLWCSNCDRVWNRCTDDWECIDCGHTHEKFTKLQEEDPTNPLIFRGRVEVQDEDGTRFRAAFDGLHYWPGRGVLALLLKDDGGGVYRPWNPKRIHIVAGCEPRPEVIESPCQRCGEEVPEDETCGDEDEWLCPDCYGLGLELEATHEGGE